MKCLGGNKCIGGAQGFCAVSHLLPYLSQPISHLETLLSAYLVPCLFLFLFFLTWDIGLEMAQVVECLPNKEGGILHMLCLWWLS
jgi:hypothetical protein